MGRAAGVPVTDHSYEDCRLMQKAKSLGLPMQAGLVEYYKLSPMIGYGKVFIAVCFCKFLFTSQGKLDTPYQLFP